MSLNSLDLRVGDGEREQIAADLGQHMALGRLTLHELESRLDIAFTAKTRRQLDALISDLPRAEPAQRPASAPVQANESPPSNRSWRPWALTGVICLLVWLATSLTQGHPVNFWPIWVIGPWGAVILAHAVSRPRT